MNTYDFTFWDAPYSVDSILKIKNAFSESEATWVRGDISWGTPDIVRYILKGKLCEHSINNVPCMKCHSCVSIDAKEHSCVTEYYPSKAQYKVDDIHEIMDNINKAGNFNDRKYIVMYDAHKMNINAANSWLKTLEEPPEETTILMVSPFFRKLMPTIRSRLKKQDWGRPSKTDICVWLAVRHGVRSTEIDSILDIAWADPVGTVTTIKEDSDKWHSRWTAVYDLYDLAKNGWEFDGETDGSSRVERMAGQDVGTHLTVWGMLFKDIAKKHMGVVVHPYKELKKDDVKILDKWVKLISYEKAVFLHEFILDWQRSMSHSNVFKLLEMLNIMRLSPDAIGKIQKEYI
jgi:hypothetical protein